MQHVLYKTIKATYLYLLWCTFNTEHDSAVGYKHVWSCASATVILPSSTESSSWFIMIHSSHNSKGSAYETDKIPSVISISRCISVSIETRVLVGRPQFNSRQGQLLEFFFPPLHPDRL